MLNSNPSRRELLALLGGVGAARAANAAESCTPAAAAQTQGPYWIDEMLNRSDIRVDPSTGKQSVGTPLNLALSFHDVHGCKAIEGAKVDIWQCDATGLYSDQRENGTVGKKFLRGYQIASADGGVNFTTVYPGWYHGRTVHIHFRIRRRLESGAVENFTSQLYFPEELNDQVLAQDAYAGRKERRDMRNDNDMILHGHGEGAVLFPAMKSQGTGYAGVLDIGIDFSKKAQEFGPPPGGGGGRGRGPRPPQPIA